MKRILITVESLLGLGHVTRALTLALALHEAGTEVHVVTGAAPAFWPDGPVRHRLPPVRAADERFAALVTPQGEPADDRLLKARRDDLVALFRRLRPHYLITEHFPFGRWKLRHELIALLEEARRAGALIAASLRDILIPSRHRARVSDQIAIANRFYDLVLVHGDPGLIRLEESFPVAAALTVPIIHSGLIARRAAVRTREKSVLVSCGSGATAARLMATARAAAQTQRGALPRWHLIAGPRLGAFDHPIDDPVGIEPPCDDLPARLAGAAASISQAGYNTAYEALAAGTPALLVPQAVAGQSEQPARARRLAALGLAHRIDEADLTGPALLDALEHLMADPPRPAPFAFDGARRAARHLLAARHADAAAVRIT